jgi:hypothetical protein
VSRAEPLQLHKLGSIKGKRKLETFAPSPAQLAKVQKLDGQTSANSMPPPALPAKPVSKGKEKAATVEDGSDDEDATNGDERSFAPGNDSDYFREEDDEGRFFGGGLTDTQKSILEIMDDGTEADEAAPVLNLPAVRRKLLDLEKAINKNREQRTRYASDPTKCATAIGSVGSILTRRSDSLTPRWPSTARYTSCSSSPRMLAPTIPKWSASTSSAASWTSSRTRTSTSPSPSSKC